MFRYRLLKECVILAEIKFVNLVKFDCFFEIFLNIFKKYLVAEKYSNPIEAKNT